MDLKSNKTVLASVILMVFGVTLFGYAYISKPARMPTWATLKSGPLRDELKKESDLLSEQFPVGTDINLFIDQMNAQHLEQKSFVKDANGRVGFEKKFASHGCCIQLHAYYDENGKITSTDATVLSDTEPSFT